MIAIQRMVKARNWLIFILITFFALVRCTGNRSRDKDVSSPQASTSEEKDSTYLFNGKTLEGWEVTDFGPQGPVSISGDQIVLGMGEGCTGVTWKGKFPESNYMVSLEAKRVSGNDFFCGLTFPVGKEHCSLIIGGWGGTVVGLSSINKLDASENETTRLMRFENNHWYRIRLVVRKDSIMAMIDDEPVVNFAKGNKTLSIRPEVDLSKPFGIASWYTTAALRNIKLDKI